MKKTSHLCIMASTNLHAYSTFPMVLARRPPLHRMGVTEAALALAAAIFAASSAGVAAQQASCEAGYTKDFKSFLSALILGPARIWPQNHHLNISSL